MNEKKIRFVMLAMTAILLTSCGSHQNARTEGGAENPTTETENYKTENTKKSDTMELTIDENKYQITLEDNELVRQIAENLPLKLEMERYAGHEYYAKLPFTPEMAGDTTSKILAGLYIIGMGGMQL